MIEEALPILLKFAARLSNKELRENFEKGELNFATGENDVTLNEQIASHPGCDLLHPLEKSGKLNLQTMNQSFRLGKTAST